MSDDQMDYVAAVNRTLKNLLEARAVIDQTRATEVGLILLTKSLLRMVPEDQREELEKRANEILRKSSLERPTLIQAIRAALFSHLGEWMSTTDVRDSLIESGFDFSGYVSNPLASISTTLKRLALNEPGFERTIIKGVAGYRAKKERPKAAVIQAINKAVERSEAKRRKK
jgi:hypothetical protein